jgi:hypothetical protein
MKLEDLALCTREEFEQQLNKMRLDSKCKNPGDYDAVFAERASIRRSVKRLRIEALLDGKLTVDQVVDQEHVDGNDEYLDLDGMNRGALEETLKRLNAGEDRTEIIDETFDAMELF